jgi:hypothetical protein
MSLKKLLLVLGTAVAAMAAVAAYIALGVYNQLGAPVLMTGTMMAQARNVLLLQVAIVAAGVVLVVFGARAKKET